MKQKLTPFLSAFVLFCYTITGQTQNTSILNDPIDVSKYFKNYQNTFYFADQLVSFNPQTGKGVLRYKRYSYKPYQAFNNMIMKPDTAEANDFPESKYETSPELPFEIQFISDRSIRIKIASNPQFTPQEESLMLANGKAPNNPQNWRYSRTEKGYKYKGPHGSVEIISEPWHVKIYNEKGKLLTSTLHNTDTHNTNTPVLPFSYVRRNSDYSRSMAAVFSLQPNEKIFGCGESFTQFNKRGQKVILWADDANGVQSERMYKPIPFYLSNRGYGVFMHHSSPITVDFGKSFNEANTMMIGDNQVDIFIFLGKPKTVLNEYTNLTGKSEMPPLWSFGFWMSRKTYSSEHEGYGITKNLREYNIPADVIHFDTGWLNTNKNTPYKFASNRFDNPQKMISDFKKNGFETSLWQLPLFTSKNTLFKEIASNHYVVKNRKGVSPSENAVLDFSNPKTVNWYQGKLKTLLEQGVGVFNADLGETAPASGLYHSGKTGFYEHNLYPLRYNKAIAEITKKEKGYNLIWARSAWAGSQRYPVHWSGNATTTNNAMAATLRGGLSLGLSGFSFWSHDIGGSANKSPENLYRRWTPFGMLSSHVRSHGEPPTEPWMYSDRFLDDFRKADNMRYKLMPYIYTQAKESSEKGLPMMRALFIEFPDDPGAWLIDDQYMFGSEMLVAPLFEDKEERIVYLPKGKWIDYQTGNVYKNGWHTIKTGEIPIIILVKNGAAIPHIQLAQSTKDMDWSQLQLRVFATKNTTQAKTKIFLPGEETFQELNLTKEELGNFILTENPLEGKTTFKIE